MKKLLYKDTMNQLEEKINLLDESLRSNWKLLEAVKEQMGILTRERTELEEEKKQIEIVLFPFKRSLKEKIAKFPEIKNIPVEELHERLKKYIAIL